MLGVAVIKLLMLAAIMCVTCVDAIGGNVQLKYQGMDLGFDCSVSDSCKCAYCSSIRFAIDLFNSCLSIAIENESEEHYRWIVCNVEALAEAARIQIEERYGSRMVH